MELRVRYITLGTLVLHQRSGDNSIHLSLLRSQLRGEYQASVNTPNAAGTGHSSRLMPTSQMREVRIREEL